MGRVTVEDDTLDKGAGRAITEREPVVYFGKLMAAPPVAQ
jgi:hypothetical protein